MSWQNSNTQRTNDSVENEDVRYLVEERHLLGPRYIESRLSSWMVRQISTKSHVTIRERLKTGHWYQFRVAVINGNGSRGYSQPSRPFKTRGENIILNAKYPSNQTNQDICIKLNQHMKYFNRLTEIKLRLFSWK